MRAYCLIRDQPWYRRHAFVQGLRAAGHEVRESLPTRWGPGDLLVIWNRYGNGHALACQVEAAQGLVLVAENGYIGAGGTSPKYDVHPGGPKPHHYYALGFGFHNDHERVPAGGPERWGRMGLEIKPLRTEGRHILVLPNRSFGVPGRMMPSDWAARTARQLQAATGREVRVRAHPGNRAPQRPLEADLEGAWAAVCWYSTAGLHALLAGVPVFCHAPHWIGKPAAAEGTIENPIQPDRESMFRRLAWGQWTVSEIESGEPFRHLLPAAKKDSVAASA